MLSFALIFGRPALVVLGLLQSTLFHFWSSRSCPRYLSKLPICSLIDLAEQHDFSAAQLGLDTYSALLLWASLRAVGYFQLGLLLLQFRRSSPFRATIGVGVTSSSVTTQKKTMPMTTQTTFSVRRWFYGNLYSLFFL